MLPNRVTLSKTATDKLRNIKGLTQLTPNVLARVAIMLALRDANGLVNASVADANGQVLNRDVLFGEYAYIYEVLINEYVHEFDIDQPLADVIVALIEIGVHKMGHVKSPSDVVNLRCA